MTEQKRKTHTSTDVKRKYNERVYTQIRFSVSKELAAQFKEKCAADGIAQAQVLKAAVLEYLNK